MPIPLAGILAVLPVLGPAQEPQHPGTPRLTAQRDDAGQVLLAESGHPVLRYIARKVELPAGYLERVAEGNRIYARPRSGYIHPLHGLDGEELTLDWSLDHPHHRGIYWAWPEVEFGEEKGDLHALQRVHSRPVGEPALTSAHEFARVEAKNLWLWEDDAPVVFERVAITVHASSERGSRAVDLELRFEALVGGVRIARRETRLYGGLNTRLAPVDGLELDRFTSPPDAETARAWSTATGTWPGGRRTTTLAILEHPANPGFPDDWITYADLPWFQPAFPPAGVRFDLRPGEPLTLRYRFLILGGAAEAQVLAAAWDAYAATKPRSLETEPDAREP